MHFCADQSYTFTSGAVADAYGSLKSYQSAPRAMPGHRTTASSAAAGTAHGTRRAKEVRSN